MFDLKWIRLVFEICLHVRELSTEKKMKLCLIDELKFDLRYLIHIKGCLFFNQIGDHVNILSKTLLAWFAGIKSKYLCLN